MTKRKIMLITVCFALLFLLYRFCYPDSFLKALEKGIWMFRQRDLNR